MYHAVDIAMKKKSLVLLMIILNQEEMKAEKWNAANVMIIMKRLGASHVIPHPET